MRPYYRRGASLLTALIATIFIAGCAYSTGARVEKDIKPEWLGRISVRLETAPIQTMTAAFELRGNPEHGELALSTPLGTQLAHASWKPGAIEWRTAGETRSFQSMDAMAVQLTGTALPITALFDWLHGLPTSADGWTPDLREFAQGRINARRELPEPKATIRLVLDR